MPRFVRVTRASKAAGSENRRDVTYVPSPDRVRGQPPSTLAGYPDGRRGRSCVCRTEETRVLRTVGLMVTFALGLLAAPLAAEAQQPTKVPRIGFLGTWPINPHYEALRQGLHEFGYVEGQNIAIERRYFEGRTERLHDLATQLVRLKVDVIVVDACGAPLNATSQASSTIPIVVAACNDDLVATGLISSLARPGGNITGLSELTPELGAKRLELLKEAAPKVRRVAVLWNPAYSERFSANFRFWSSDWTEMRAAAQVLGMTLQSVEIRGPDDFDTAFSSCDSMPRPRSSSTGGGLIWSTGCGPRSDTEENQARPEGRGQLQPARAGLGAGAHVHRARADNSSPPGAARVRKVRGPVHARRSRRATKLRGSGSQPLNGQEASQGTRPALRASPA